MNLSELRLFSHLAKSLHYGRTSQACNVTPSALTRAIQRLEQEVGKTLFYRDNRTVSLTPEGLLFRDYAEDVLARWAELQNDLSEDGKLLGEISLYCSVTAMMSILPSILAAFRNSYPGVNVTIQTGDAAAAINRLQENSVDLTIAALPESLPHGLQFFPLMETPLICIASSTYTEVTFMENGQIDWQQTPVIVAERGLSRIRLESWFRRRGLAPNISAQAAGNEAIIALVNTGCGVGFIPEVVLENSPMKTQITRVENGPDLGGFCVGICTKTKNLEKRIIRSFWEVAAGNRDKT